MQAFIDRHGITFPTLNDSTGELFSHFGVPAQPAWVFVSPNGTVTTNLGAMESPELDKALATTIAGT
jgi:peroxiredoxin